MGDYIGSVDKNGRGGKIYDLRFSCFYLHRMWSNVLGIVGRDSESKLFINRGVTLDLGVPVTGH